jgi:hypothetical protein
MSQYRVEIVGNRSVQEDLVDLLDGERVGRQRTLFPEAQGVGRAGERRGDHVWPEENFVMVIYCDEAEARTLVRIVSALHGRFPDEGLAIFATRGVELSELGE